MTGGRYLGDVWILALDTLTWTPVSGPAKSAPPTPSQNGDAAVDALTSVSQPLPPCAGHAMIAWGSKLLVLGGHMKVHSGLLPTAASLGLIVCHSDKLSVTVPQQVLKMHLKSHTVFFEA